MRGGPATPAETAGFTLLELLVALAIAGLVSLIAMQGVGLATRGVTRLSERAERLDQRRGLEMQLRRALGASPALAMVDGAPGFIGHRTGFSFLTLVEEGGAGLYRLTLTFEPDRDERPLVLTRLLAGSAAPQRSERGALAHGIGSVSFAYFGAATPADKPAWQAAWEGRVLPPTLVRMIVDMGDGTALPPMIFRVGHAS